METILGIRGPSFAMLAADTSHLRGIVVLEDNVKKIYPVSKSIMISAVGSSGDPPQFIDFIKRNLSMYNIRNGYGLSPSAVAHFARKNLAEYRRNLNQYNVSLFLGGYDKVEGSLLYFIDNMASGVSLCYGAQGFGAVLCGSIFDRYWYREITAHAAYEVFKKVIAELQKRFVVNYKKFNVCIVDKDGIRNVEPIMINPQIRQYC